MPPRKFPAAVLRILPVVLIVSALGCSTSSNGADDRVVDGPAAPDEASVSAGSGEDRLEPQVPPLVDAVDDLDEVVISLIGARGAVRVDAKVASTDDSRRRGLMDVTSLPDGVGMLFVFPDERTGGFWMKNTLVPLDIAFADPNGMLLEILTMEPCTSEPCAVYDPEVAYTSALEVPRGWFAANGVREGDEMIVGDVIPAG